MTIPPLTQRSNSWVVTNKTTGEAIGEFYGLSVVSKINTDKYRVETAEQYLGRINTEILRGPMKWYESLTEPDRQRLFQRMRQLRDLSAIHDKAGRLPTGSMSVGSAWFDDFIKAVGIDSFLSAIGKGSNPEQALAIAHSEMTAATKTHNARHEWQQQRWEQTAQDYVSFVVKQLTVAKPMAKKVTAHRNKNRTLVGQSFVALPRTVA